MKNQIRIIIFASVAFQAMAMEKSPSNSFIITSSDGKEFTLPIRTAMLSQQIKGLIESSKQTRLALNVPSNIVTPFVQLLTSLDSLVLQSSKNIIYIPRAYQPLAKSILQNVNSTDIAALYYQANSLRIPLIQNAIAAIIADAIVTGLPQAQNSNWLMQQKNNQQALINAQIQSKKFIPFNTGVDTYLLKQVALRSLGIKEEFSVADYIQKNGPLGPDQEGTIRIQNAKITSLFGIGLLQNQKNVRSLDFSHNAFYDFSTDPQGVTRPFQSFANLEILDLSYCSLITLPAEIFMGLRTLETLDLGNNLFDQLPNQLFTDLRKLRELYLQKNIFLKQESQQAIRSGLKVIAPRADVIFNINQ